MNAPEAKNPLSGSHDLVLIRKVRQLRPSSLDTACQVSMSWLAGSRRRSNQIAYRSPAGLESTHGKNWSLRAPPPPAPLLSVRVLLQVKPPSREIWREMSAPEVAAFTW